MSATASPPPSAEPPADGSAPSKTATSSEGASLAEGFDTVHEPTSLQEEAFQTPPSGTQDAHLPLHQEGFAASAQPERAPDDGITKGVPLRAVVISDTVDESLYTKFDGTRTVKRVLREVNTGGHLRYEIMFRDTRRTMVPFDLLIELEGGADALEIYNYALSDSSDEEDMTTRAADRSTKQSRQVIASSDESDPDLRGALRRSGRMSKLRASSFEGIELLSSSEDDEESEVSSRRQLRRKTRRARNSRGGKASHQDLSENDDDDDDDDDDNFMLQSDVLPRTNKQNARFSRGTNMRGGETYRLSNRLTMRRSGRLSRHVQSMEQVGEDTIDLSDDGKSASRPAPKISVVREEFIPLPRNNEFRLRHMQQCETCGQNTQPAALIFCQGCSLAYHKHCISHRSSREHLVTKVGPKNFVLQCRRCINTPKKKDAYAPDLACCQVCQESNPSSQPFRPKKTPAQEQKERDENYGVDPIVEVEPRYINQVENVLFRCITCFRGFHFHHLPSRSRHGINDPGYDSDGERAERRFGEYQRDFSCIECATMSAKVVQLVAWRPSDPDAYSRSTTQERLPEDAVEYLVRWEAQSYFRATWMPGAWTWGTTSPSMRRAFLKREPLPKMTFEQAVPEEFLRIDIVLDVRFKSIVDIRTEEVDKARVKEVDQALIKYKGLGYEDAVWEKVPTTDEGDRWDDFVVAYNDWVLGRYIHVPKTAVLKVRLQKVRDTNFQKLEKKQQPSTVVGGELMQYQLDGLNWLYWQWHSQKNGILADEMGLGKTIQIISFLATMIQDHNCFPFLIVVPNSTCPNWRREIKKWAPSLRVVTFYGVAKAKQMARDYELFPEKSKDVRAHIVVTSYEAAADEHEHKFFKKVPWAGLIVDEGQRLKSDKTILYDVLASLSIPFRILLTGTPLQNNARELFNLLQFLDTKFDAAALEAEFAEMGKEQIKSLHERIRPYILRRTKAQVLTFLPPMAQIIVPISMNVLQKKVYTSILSRDADVLRALMSTDKALKAKVRAKLANVLMQLRKAVCHPFVYSSEIEERSDVAAVSHRNLVEASAKLQLLEILLPKLQARGHRVLLFSQFLGMLSVIEDFLDGLGMRYQRLDGTIGSLEKQKRIDEFNSVDSPLFAFLLSTRAGGVGINLASADTVIILDPDFNPHQDIQALSRAHRIGQTKKVLCFQLMTRATVEERIMQMGRGKMALDHVVVQKMDAEDFAEKDIEGILMHGASELLSGAEEGQDIKYDSASIDKLLDRSQMENTHAGEDESAESQFSFARVWDNTNAALETTEAAVPDDLKDHDPTVWESILQDREKRAAESALNAQQVLGRGKRARTTIDYSKDEVNVPEDKSPSKPRVKRARHDSDTDFLATDGEESTDDEHVNPKSPTDHFSRVSLPRHPAPYTAPNASGLLSTNARTALANVGMSGVNVDRPGPKWVRCPACHNDHIQGSCPLKEALVEFCPLCGLAHFGYSRVCPHQTSETQVRLMLETVKYSPEPHHIKEEAKKYLKGLKGNLVREKKYKNSRLQTNQQPAQHPVQQTPQ